MEIGGLTLLGLLALAAVAWLLLDTASARDAARVHARRICKDLGVQLLDQTVALSRTRLTRNASGALWLERHFRFEFSEAGNDRNLGQVRVRGRHPVHITLEGAGIGRVVMGADAE
jgi:hypothetical protein